MIKVLATMPNGIEEKVQPKDVDLTDEAVRLLALYGAGWDNPHKVAMSIYKAIKTHIP